MPEEKAIIDTENRDVTPPIPEPEVKPAEPKAGDNNIIFTGTRNRNGEEERLTEAPVTLINGPATYELPPSSEQFKGFYHPQAAEICRAFPGLYKPITKKGE